MSGHYIDLIVDIRKNWLLLKFCVTMLAAKGICARRAERGRASWDGCVQPGDVQDWAL